MNTPAAPRRDFDHLREHSIGLPGVLFQSIIYVEDETVAAAPALAD